MRTLTLKSDPKACDVEFTSDEMTVMLDDARRISVPLVWFPRLFHSSPEEREEWELIGSGDGIHWPLIDEDISVEGLLEGSPSGESQKSLKRWMASRPERSLSKGSKTRKRPAPRSRDGRSAARKK